MAIMRVEDQLDSRLKSFLNAGGKFEAVVKTGLDVLMPRKPTALASDVTLADALGDERLADQELELPSRSNQ